MVLYKKEKLDSSYKSGKFNMVLNINDKKRTYIFDPRIKLSWFILSLVHSKSEYTTIIGQCVRPSGRPLTW